MNPALAMGGVVAALGACFVALRLLDRWVSPHPEILRKLMHVLMGLVAATFPWLFDSSWPVLLLAGGSLVVLVLLRSGFRALRSFNAVLHGVERTSWGELLFPIAVATLFVLADGNALLYSVPILVLALADAVAALIGVYYGQVQFSTLEGTKSVEGSLAFFFVAFLCVHVAVLLFTDVDRAESLLIGVVIGVLVMMFEAVAWRGLDNLFIPVASFSLLHAYLDMDTASLALHLGIIVLLGIFLLFWRRRSTLDDSALIGAGLVAYVAWALGGLYWLLVPVLMFVMATVLAARTAPQQRKTIHTVYTLLSVSSAGLFWLLLHDNIYANDFFFPYALAFGAHLTMLGIAREHYGRERMALLQLWPTVLQGWLVVVIPYLVLDGLTAALIVPAVFALLGVLLAAMAFFRLQPSLIDCPDTPARWTRQALIAAMASVIGWLLVNLGADGVAI